MRKGERLYQRSDGPVMGRLLLLQATGTQSHRGPSENCGEPSNSLHSPVPLSH